MRYNTGIIYVTTINKDNLDKAMEIYAAKVAELSPELDDHMETLAIETTITDSLLNAGTVHTAVKGQYYATIDGHIIYYRILNQIQEHTPDNTRVLVTVGPMIQWGYDENLSTYEESDIGGSYIIALTKDNLSEAADLYAEAEDKLADKVGTYINSLTLGSTISASAIGASSTRTIVGSKSGRTYYFRPTYLIPAHRSDTRSVTITIHSSINFGETNNLGRNCDIGSQYETTLTITPENKSQMATLYTEKVDSMRNALDAYIITLALGRTITESDLGLSGIFTANQTISGESIYFKPNYTIPTHNQWDISVTITLGPYINYGTTTNNLNSSYNANTNSSTSYKYDIVFEKDNINERLVIFNNRLNILKDRFDEYLASIVLGTLITPSTLETTTVHSCTVYNKVYYFRASSYSIPGHRTDDRSVTIDIGKDVIYSTNQDLSGTSTYTTNGTSPITITRSNLNSAANVYYNAVQNLGSQLATYIESTKLGTTVTSNKLGADTIRSFTTTVNKRTIYYRVSYVIPAHSSGDDSVTITQGSAIQYGPTSNNLSYTYDPGSNYVYHLTFNRQNVSSCGSIYAANIPAFQQALDDYFSSLILGTKVTANMLGAGVIRTLSILNRGVYYRPTWNIPEHEETDEEVIITIGPTIEYGLTNSGLTYTYDVGSENVQRLSVTVNNIKDPSGDYREKCEVLREILKQYLATQIGTFLPVNPYYSNIYQRREDYDVIPTNIYYNINLTNNTPFGSEETSGSFTLTGLCGRTAGAINISTGKTRTISTTITNYEADIAAVRAELEEEMKSDVFDHFLYDIKCNDTSILNNALEPNYTYILHNPENTISKSYYVSIIGTVLSNWYTTGARVKVKTTYGIESNDRTKNNFMENEINLAVDENGSATQAIQTLINEKNRQFGKIKEYFDTFIGPISNADYAYQYDSKVTGLTYFIRVQYKPVDGFEPYTSQTAVVDCKMTWGTESIDGPFDHKGSQFTVTITNHTYDQYLDEIIAAANAQGLETEVLDKVLGPITTVIEEYSELTIDVTGYSEEVTLGQNTSMLVEANGGRGNKTLSCNNSNVKFSGKVATFKPTEIGNYTLIFTATDTVTNTASKAININVKEAEIPLSINIVKYDSTVIFGKSSNISIQVNGGRGNKTLTCNNEDVTFSGNIARYYPSSLGNFVLTFTVTDEVFNSASKSITVNVEQEKRIEEETYVNDAGVTYYFQTIYTPSQEYVPYESEEVELQVEVKYGTEPGHYDQVVSTSVAKVDTTNYKEFKVEPKLLVVEEVQEQQEEPIIQTIEEKIIEKQESVARAIGEIEVVDKNDTVETTTGITYYTKTVYSVDSYNPYSDETTTITAITEWGYTVGNETYVVGTLENLETVIDATNYANYDEVVEIAIQSQKDKLQDYLDTLLGPISIPTETENYVATTTNLNYYIETTYNTSSGFTPYSSTSTDITIVLKWGITGLEGPFDYNGGSTSITIINTNYADHETLAKAKAEELRQSLRSYLNTLLGPISMSDSIVEYTTKSTKILYFIKTSFAISENFTPYVNTTTSIVTTTSYGTERNNANTYYTSSSDTVNKDNYNHYNSATETYTTYADLLNQRKAQQVRDCEIYLERLLGDLVYEDYTKSYISPLTGLRYYEKTTFTAGEFDPQTDDTFNISIKTYWGTENGVYPNEYASSVETVRVSDYLDDLENVYATGNMQRAEMEEYLAPLIGPLDLISVADISPYTSTTTGLNYYIRTTTSATHTPYTSTSATIYVNTSWGTQANVFNHNYTDFNDQYKTVEISAANYKDGSYKTTQNFDIETQRDLLKAYLNTLLGPLSVSEPITESVDSAVKENITYYIQTVFTLPSNYTSGTVSVADISVKTYWSTDPEDISTYFVYDDNNPNTYDDKIIVNINNYQLEKYKVVDDLEVLDEDYDSYMDLMLDLGVRQREACKEYLRELIFPEDVYEEYTTTTTNKLYYIRTINTVKDTNNFYPDKTNNVNVTTSYSATPNTYDKTSYTLNENTVTMNVDKIRNDGDAGETYVNNINGEGLNQRNKLHQYLDSIIGPIDIRGYNETYTSPKTGLSYHVEITATPPDDFDPYGDTETVITVRSKWQYSGGNLTDYNTVTFNLRVKTNIGEANEEFKYDDDMAAITAGLETEYESLKTYLDTLMGEVIVSEYIEEYTSPRTGLTFDIKVTHTTPTSYTPYSGETSVDIDLAGYWSMYGSQYYGYHCMNSEHNHDIATVTIDNYISYGTVITNVRNKLLECMKSYLDTVVGFIDAEDIDEIYEAKTGIKYHITVKKTVENFTQGDTISNINVFSDWTTVDGDASGEFERNNFIIVASDFATSGETVSAEVQGQYTRLKEYLDSLFGKIPVGEYPIEYTNDVNMKFYINSYVFTDEYTPYVQVDNDYGVLATVHTKWSTEPNQYTEFFECPYEDTYYVVSLATFEITPATLEAMVIRQQEALKAYLNTLAGPPYSDKFEEVYTTKSTKKTYYIVTYYDRDATFFRAGTTLPETVHTKWGRFENTYDQEWQTEIYVINDENYDSYEAVVDNMGLVQREELKKYLESLIDSVDIEPTQLEYDYWTDPLKLHLFIRVSYSVTASSETQANITFVTNWSLDYDTKYRNTYNDAITELIVTSENFDIVQEKIDRIVASNVASLEELSNSFMGPLPELGAADGLTYVNLTTGVTWYYLKSYTATEYNYLDGYTGDVEIFGTYGLGCEGVENTIENRFGNLKEYDLTIQNYFDTYTSSYTRTLISFSENQEEIGKLLGPVTVPKEEYDDFAISDGRHVYAKTMYVFDDTNETYEEFMIHGLFYDETVTIVCITMYGFSKDSWDYMFLTERYEITAEKYKSKNTDMYNIYLDHMEKLRKMFQMFDIHVDDYDTDFTNMGGLQYVIRSRFIQADVSYAANSILYKTSYCLKSKDYEDNIYDVSTYTVTLDTFVSREQSETELKLLEDAKVEELKNLLDTPNILPISTDNEIHEAPNGMKFVLRVRFTRNPEAINKIDCAYFIDGEQYGPTLTRVYHRTEEEAQEDMEFIQEQGLEEMRNLCDSNIPEDVDIIYPEEGNFRYHVKMNYEKIAGDTGISIFASFDGVSYTAKKCYVNGSTFVADMTNCRTTASATLDELKKAIDDTMPKSENVIYEKGKSKFGIDITYNKNPDSILIKCEVKCDNDQISDESMNMDNIKNLENIINNLKDRIEIIRTDITSYIDEIYPDTGYDSLQKNGFKYAMNTEYVKEANSHDVLIVVKLDKTEYGTHNSHFDYKETRTNDIVEMNTYYNIAKQELISLIAISNPDKEKLYMFDNLLYNVETNYNKEENESEVSIVTRLDGYIYKITSSPLTIANLITDMSTAQTIAEADYNELEEIVNTSPYDSYDDIRVIDTFEYKCGASYYKLSNQQTVLVNILLDENIMEQYEDTITATNTAADIYALKLKAATKTHELLQRCRGILDEEYTYSNDNMVFTLDIQYVRRYPDKNYVYVDSLVENIQYESRIKEQFYFNKIDDYREIGRDRLQALKDLIDSLPKDTEEVYIVNGFGFNISSHYQKYKHTNYVTITIKLDGVTVKTGTVTFNPNRTIDIENKADQLVNEIKMTLNSCPADFEELYSPDDSNFAFLIGGKYYKKPGDLTVSLYNVLDYDLVYDRTVIVDFDINKINRIKIDISWLKSQLDQSPYNHTEDYHITRPNNKVDCHFYISREYSKVAGNKQVTTTILLDGEIYGNVDVRDYNVNYPTETEDYANLVVGDLKDKLDTIILSDINTAYKKYGFDFNIEVYFTKATGAKDITVSYKIEKRKQLDYGDLSEIEIIDI